MKIPKAETVKAYLRAKGWMLEGETESFWVMKPPKGIQFSTGFQYKIPRNESALDYKEYALRQVFSIADLYNADKWELLELLSQSLAQIHRDIQFKQALLSNAS